MGAHFERRIEAIGKCRELVADHPGEREEVKDCIKSKKILYRYVLGAVAVEQRGEGGGKGGCRL